MAGIDSNTALCLHCEGTDGGTTFTDSSLTPKSVTRQGNAQTSTAEFKFGSAAALFDGTGDYLDTADSADWDIFGAVTTDRTLDLWVKHTDHVGSEIYMSQLESVSPFTGWYFRHLHGTGIELIVIVNDITVINLYGGEIVDTNWHHVALCKKGGASAAEYGIYKDGTQVAYVSDNSTAALASTFDIGANNTGGNSFDGYLDEIRVQKSNYFLAAPNVGKTNTIIVPTEAYSVPSAFIPQVIII